MSDEEFVENIRKCVFNKENIARCRRLVKEGKLKYIVGFHCGYFAKCK